METKRNTQLDGWRAFAVMGVMWFHWAPVSWRGPFPFEIGLYYFLTLTGFFITRVLLRERENREGREGSWRRRAFIDFQKRRFSRILVPCYVAMVFAILVGAPDIRHHAIWYFGHMANFHIATLPHWPSGTSHYWTLAIQMQFYLFWPLVVFWVPRRSLGWVFVLCGLMAPCSRFVIESWFPNIHHPGAITTSALDYFAAGAWLAFLFERGVKPGDKRVNRAAWAAFAGYVILYSLSKSGRSIVGFCYIQQTLLSVSFAGLISATLAGISGIVGRLLDHPVVQHVGQLSYGLYLFHTVVPLFLGLVLPFIWNPAITGWWIVVRLLVFTLVSWRLAWLCWRWLEGPERLSFLRFSESPRK